MAKDILFEIGTEELPPTALTALSHALGEGFRTQLEASSLGFGNIRTYATPRRLAVLIEGCDDVQPDQHMERRGPSVAAAFDAEGRPTKAALGFAKGCQVEMDQLARIDTPKGEWLVYRKTSPGRSAMALLPDIARQALDALPIPKRMRWGDQQDAFIRPVHWILFLSDTDIIPCELFQIAAGRVTYGHRFHHPEAITVEHPRDYADILEHQGKIIADSEERKARIAAAVTACADALQATADDDPALLEEVSALVEWPVAIVASFDDDFLSVPAEALVLTMKKNQKYFPLFDQDQRLINRFITIANIDSTQPELIRSGNERVIRPRLADAKFFWDKDIRQPLGERRAALDRLVFQHKLGSIGDKTQRIEQLSALIAEQVGGDPAKAARAALLSRCDLVSEMVLEFPEMQGIMGRYLATQDQEDPEVADAIDSFYRPRQSGDPVPESLTAQAVALADRLDTLVGIFAIGERPSGDKDPYALRRAAIGLVRIISDNALRLDLRELLQHAARGFSIEVSSASLDDVYSYILERLKGLYADQGVQSDIVNAVCSMQPPDLVDIRLRILAIQGFRQDTAMPSLIAANKRIDNFLKKSDAGRGHHELATAHLQDPAEIALYQAMTQIEAGMDSAVTKGDYPQALAELASIRDEIDRFFDHVMVLCEDTALRENRLALLHRLSQRFYQIADFSLLTAA